MPNFDAIKPIPSKTHNFMPTRISPKPKRRWRKWLWLFVIVVLLGAGVWGSAVVLGKTNQIFTGKKNIFSRIGGLLIAQDKPLIGEDSGVVNILLLGIGGPGHDGPNLTDTMIVASLNVKTKEVVLTSIPRDFMISLPPRGLQKINAAYAYAEKDAPGTGGEAAIAQAEKLTGLTIPYYATVDFAGFVKAVDDVGGVDVTVDRTFTDSSYPDYNNGYLPPVTFTKGPQHMDGQRALIFARSRHGDNGEGSDFARSERQKKVIVAMKDKVGALGLNSLSTITNLLGDFTNNFRTNLEPFELKRLADLATGISSDNIYSFSLDPDDKLICSGLIDLATGLPAVRVPVTPVTPPSTTPSTTPSGTKSTNKSSATTSITTTTTTTTDTPPDTVLPSTAGYVVLPCAGKTIADIQQYVTNAPLLAKLKKEGALVEVQNSTGLASRARVWNDLASLGVNIKDTTFKGKTPYDQTILYDNSNGSKPHTLDYLKNNFQFTTSDVGFPSSTADFVVVIGKDAQ